jgi:hypothetical protein
MTILKRLPRPLAAIFAAFALILGLQVAPAVAPAGSIIAPPTASASSYLTICLSTASTPSGHPITIFHEGDYDLTHKYLNRGDCDDIYNADGLARVAIPWYDRYWIGVENEGYGSCHNGPQSWNGNPSNPPNANTTNQYVKYKTGDDNSPC